MKIGILSLQGDFAEHTDALSSVGYSTRVVKSPEDLEDVDGLVMPGGESTTIGKLLAQTGLDHAIIRLVKNGMPVWGTCAGAILLAKTVVSKEPVYELGLIDIEIMRNAYGSQVDSFEVDLILDGISFHTAFIRAPIIKQVGADSEVLISYNDDPVLVRSKNILVSTFHPELFASSSFYEWLKNNFFKNG